MFCVYKVSVLISYLQSEVQDEEQVCLYSLVLLARTFEAITAF